MRVAEVDALRVGRPRDFGVIVGGKQRREVGHGTQSLFPQRVGVDAQRIEERLPRELQHRHPGRLGDHGGEDVGTRVRREHPAAHRVAGRSLGEDRSDPVRGGHRGRPDSERKAGRVREHRLQRDGGRVGREDPGVGGQQFAECRVHAADEAAIDRDADERRRHDPGHAAYVPRVAGVGVDVPLVHGLAVLLDDDGSDGLLAVDDVEHRSQLLVHDLGRRRRGSRRAARRDQQRAEHGAGERAPH